MNYWLVKQEPQSYSFDTFKAEPKLSEILLVRNSRISVVPLTKTEFEMILKMSA
jgi:predicted RNA-binding protein with PUA-like domain